MHFNVLNLHCLKKVTSLMLQMASSDHLLQQSVAAELIVFSVSKYERAANMIKHGLVSNFQKNFFLFIMSFFSQC